MFALKTHLTSGDARLYIRSHCDRGSRRPFSRSAQAALMAGVVLALVACNGGSSRGPSPTGTLQVVNAVSDSRVLSIEFNEQPFETISFKQSTSIQTGIVGDLEMDAEYVSNLGAVTAAIDNFPVELKADTASTVILSGGLEAPTVTVLEHDITEVADDTAEIQFFNAVTNAGRLDFHLVDPSVDTISGSALVTIGANTRGTMQLVDPGSYRILVANEGDSVVRYDSGAFDIADGTRGVYLAVDYFGPGTQTLRMVRTSGSSASGFADERLPVAVRVAQFVGDMPTVDVYLGDTSDPADFPSQPFGVGDYVEFDRGAVTATVTVESSPTEVLFTEDVFLTAGEFRTLAIAGSNVDASIDARFIQETRRRTAFDAQISIVNASRSAGSVDFYIAIADSTDPLNPTFQSLTFLANALLVGGGNVFDVQFHLEAEDDPIAGPVNVELAADGLYSLWLTDADGGGMPPRIILADELVN